MISMRGLYAPTITTFINERVERRNSNRSTMLSVNSQFLTTHFFISSTVFISGNCDMAERYDLKSWDCRLFCTSLFE